jgi:endonuclease/exonuclease/phosphatase family metal-dependent hydrolase
MPAASRPLRRRLFVEIVAFAAGLWLSFAASRGLAAAPAEGLHRILSCNVRVPLESDAAEGNGWDDRRELCADVIAAQDADVVCLQECRIAQREYLLERMPEFDAYGLSNPDAQFTPNNSILYARERYELVSAGGYWLSETPHVAGSRSWGSNGVRFTNWVHLRERATGREMRVWNAHLDHVSHEARAEQARLLVEGATAMDASGVPQLLVGDMNAHAAHPAIVALVEGGFRDTYGAVHGPADPGHTFHRFLGPKFADVLDRERRPGRKIDWIFTRGSVEAHAASIIRDGQGGRFPSDHYFISADVELPEPEPAGAADPARPRSSAASAASGTN